MGGVQLSDVKFCFIFVMICAVVNRQLIPRRELQGDHVFRNNLASSIFFSIVVFSLCSFVLYYEGHLHENKIFVS